MLNFDKIVKYALSEDADHVEIRFQERRYEYLLIDNGVLRECSESRSRGLNVRVVVNNRIGYASTNKLDWESIERTVKYAIKFAKALINGGREKPLKEKSIIKDKVRTVIKEDPFDIDLNEKIKLLLDFNKYSMNYSSEVSSVITRMGCEVDKRIYVSSDGSEIISEIYLIGIGHTVVAKFSGIYERVYHQESKVSGYEFIREIDWYSIIKEVTDTAIKAVHAKTPPPGSYPVVLDNDVVGLLLHEAFGHAVEADYVEIGASVLKDRISEKIASELVTVIDDGLVEGGYYIPYDDEGVRKTKTIIVEKGVLKSYLHNRYTSSIMNSELTGNARAQDYESIPLVRQTNIYMLPGDYSFEELVEDIEFGIYAKGLGSMGGEVNPSVGTFTFSIGPSYIIRRGKVEEIVRGVVISGNILETLRYVDAVGKDFKVRTSVFGGCGKNGQMVRVGDGGPHVRVRKITIGGR